MFGNTFSVAGMSASTSSHQNNWGASSTSGQLGSSTFGDSLSQSRSHYQPGYLMSTSQNTNTPQNNQRVDETPIVQTKAKLTNTHARGSASEFGIESMFESSRQRQTYTDEDAPPLSSVHDIPHESFADSSPHGFPTKNLEASHLGRRQARAPATNSSQPIYVVVFGYPLEKYSATVEYFKSLGNATEPEPNTEVLNCFRIGYFEPADAMRAVRKNGEVLAGTWMIGAKWADSIQADSILGQPMARTSFSGPASDNFSGAMSVDEPMQSPFGSNNTAVGTPIRLAPSTSAFRKPGAPSKPTTPLPLKAPGGPNAASTTTTPASRGVMGQVSDMIFGW